ncbi:MAG: DUF2298 domain-containing protein [Vicinamibacterales bacterium]
MRAVLGWYVVVQALGAAAFVLAGPVLQRLPDRGYGVSKSLGVLMAGLLLWLGTALGLLRNDARGAVVVLAMGVTAAAVAATRRRLPGLRVVVASELVFAAAFAGGCLVRSLDPAVAHTEQPMDLMLLGAVSASPAVPPVDPWLAGYPVGYYYLGYWLVSTLGFLTGQPPEIAYNLGLAKGRAARSGATAWAPTWPPRRAGGGIGRGCRWARAWARRWSWRAAPTST